MNTKSKVGRPAFTLTYPNGPFTLNELFKLNHTPKRGRGEQKVCKLTIINHIQKALINKTVKRLKEVVRTGKAGKPSYKYSLTTKGLNRLTIPPVEVDLATPVETPAATPVETPAPVIAETVPVAEATVAV